MTSNSKSDRRRRHRISIPDASAGFKIQHKFVISSDSELGAFRFGFISDTAQAKKKTFFGLGAESVFHVVEGSQLIPDRFVWSFWLVL